MGKNSDRERRGGWKSEEKFTKSGVGRGKFIEDGD
jgi:hypothetical protein